MNTLDKVVAKGVMMVLEEDLGSVTYKKIEKEIQDMYGMSVLEAVGDFAKLDLVMRKFFGRYASNIESKIFKKVLTVDKNTKNRSTITIRNPIVAKSVFEAYGDPAKKVILDMLLDESKSIPDTITESGLAKASTYNRIKELIKDGLITMNGFANASDGRKVNQYTATFNKTIFNIDQKSISVNATIESKFLRDSYVYNSIHTV